MKATTPLWEVVQVMYDLGFGALRMRDTVLRGVLAIRGDRARAEAVADVADVYYAAIAGDLT